MITNMDNGSVTGKAYPASLAEAYEMTRLWTIPTQKKAATTTSQPMASELVWWVNRIVSTVDGPRGSRSPSDRTSSPCQSLYCHPTYIHTYIHTSSTRKDHRYEYTKSCQNDAHMYSSCRTMGRGLTCFSAQISALPGVHTARWLSSAAQWRAADPLQTSSSIKY